MKCFCSSSLPNCPPDGQILCDRDVSHCILSMRFDNTSKRFVETLLECWRWPDASRCPTQPGLCNILKHSKDNFRSCCCKGNLCNNSTALQMVEFSDSQWVNTSSLTALPGSNEAKFTHESFFLFLLIPILICVFFLIVGVFLCQLNQKRLKAAMFKEALRCSRSNRLCTCEAMRLKAAGVPGGGGSIAQCTCGYVDSLKQNGVLDSAFGYNNNNNSHIPGASRRVPKVGPGWMTEDEIEGLASKVKKLDLKSQGCFGQVWHGRFSLPTNELATSCSGPTADKVSTARSETQSSGTRQIEVAIKIFRAAQKDSWQTELSLFRLPGLAHPNILKFYGADQVTNYEGPIPDVEYWLVTEYHPLGSLYDFLRANTISWSELLRVATSVARGMTHLHAETTFAVTSMCGANAHDAVDAAVGYPKLSVAHRDLNSRNVLLKSDLTACIADFGLAIRFDPGQFPSVAHPQLGTRRYMAPEVLDGAIQFSRDAYLRIDVYAMGLVFWELLSRCTGTDQHPIQVTWPYRAPFELELGPGPTMEELQRFVAHEKQRPKFNPAWSADVQMCTLWETIEECWDQDAEARLSAGCVAKRLATLAQQANLGLDTQGTTPMAPVRPRLTSVVHSEEERACVGAYAGWDSMDSDYTARSCEMFGLRSMGRPRPTSTTVCMPVPSKCAADAIPRTDQAEVKRIMNGSCDASEHDRLLSSTHPAAPPR